MSENQTQKPQDESANVIIVNFNHRLNSYADQPSCTELVDDISLMAGRAYTVLSMLQTQYDELDKDSIFTALQTVRLDIADIESVIEHYQDQNG